MKFSFNWQTDWKCAAVITWKKPHLVWKLNSGVKTKLNTTSLRQTSHRQEQHKSGKIPRPVSLSIVYCYVSGTMVNLYYSSATTKL